MDRIKHKKRRRRRPLTRGTKQSSQTNPSETPNDDEPNVQHIRNALWKALDREHESGQLQACTMPGTRHMHNLYLFESM